MTEMGSSSDPRYAHLRANAAAQKQATVERLKEAIALLEADGRPLNTFTIKEVSGMDYMAYYRNAEALALFRTHSTHLRNEREKKQTNQHRSGRKSPKHDDTLHHIPVQSRDPLLAYKKPDLVAKLRAAYAERDQIQQHAQVEREEIQQRYGALLQAHMQCGVSISRLEAQVAEYLAFMDRFRSALRQEEHGTQQ
jgi:hypothetical protein